MGVYTEQWTKQEKGIRMLLTVEFMHRLADERLPKDCGGLRKTQVHVTPF